MSKVRWISILNDSYNPEEIAEDNFQSWCEQYNDGCNFQKAWDAYAVKYGQSQCEDTEVINLVKAAIAFGAKSALVEVNDNQCDFRSI